MKPTSTPQPAPASARSSRRVVGPVLAFLVAVVAVPGPSRAQEAAGPGRPAFTEVGRLPLVADDEVTADKVDQSGWLILDRTARRAYEVFEVAGGAAVQSFDLDTLAPIRRVVFPGIFPVVGGPKAANSQGVTAGSTGEVVHAMDEEAGRLYLAMSDPLTHLAGAPIASNSFSSDGNRPVSHYLVIDEAAFDDPANGSFAAKLPEPNKPVGWLRSLVVDRSHGTTPGIDALGRPGEFGRLVSVVTLPNGTTPSMLNGAKGQTPAVHQLRQWDVSSPRTWGDGNVGVQVPVRDAQPAAPLNGCAGASMTTAENGDGNFQWGLLMTREGAWLGCQSAPGSARAVFVELRPDGLVTGQEAAFPLSRPVTDVLVDGGGGRLLFRSFDAGGQTWWVFDTATRRFAGALAAVLTVDRFGAGIDETTGRLYMLVPDYVATDHGRAFGVRGGLQTADTRLDPVPPAENVAPELAYPAVFRIQVDPATRRVFVRRGQYGASSRFVYPNTQPSAPARVEPHYLVLRDDRPVPTRVVEGAEDDRRFTTNVAEADGVTKASYQASGSGYGARTLLIGGLGAATERSAGGALAPDCSNDDREVVAGEVESAALSDVSASATAASLGADGRTEEQAGRLVSSCNQDHASGAPATSPLEFDGPDEGEDSDFRTQCTGDDDPAERRPPDARLGDALKLPQSRAAFAADVDCRQSATAVAATATGAVATPPARLGGGTVAGQAVPGADAPVVKVGHAESKVTVERAKAGGVVVKVDSVARNVEIAGIGRIGVVRSEATSAAAGRDGTARGTFARTVCAVDIPAVLTTPQCLSDSALAELEAKFAERFSGQAELRFRSPEPELLAGSVSGFRSAVQRRAIDLFQDSSISKDDSLAVPGAELVFFRGDSPEAGAGRQIVHLAGAQAGASYGIACLYGQGPRGGCATGTGEGEDDASPEFTAPTVGPDGNLTGGAYSDGTGTGGSGARGRSLLERIRDAVTLPLRIAADVARLLFSDPREFGLMAAVWALLYLPCYLGERRRTLQGLAARRVAA
jgi:hypothetical protein